MNAALKRLANLSTVRDKFSSFVEMITQQIYPEKLMYDARYNVISYNIIRNSKLINLEENQDINKSIGSGQKIMKDFNWILF